MTKHEAVRILELYNPFLGGDDKKLLSEAIDVAIEALNHFADDSKKVSSSCGQIESDNLRSWCEIVQTEMKMAMAQLPCWAERRGEP